jgi:hypothetical protein
LIYQTFGAVYLVRGIGPSNSKISEVMNVVLAFPNRTMITLVRMIVARIAFRGARSGKMMGIRCIKSALLLSFSVLFFCGCKNLPESGRVSADFQAIFSKEVGNGVEPVIISIGPGEGDSANVYEHIRFDVIASQDVIMKQGWLANVSLHKGERLYGGEAVILYQRGKDSQWQISWYEMKRKPASDHVSP